MKSLLKNFFQDKKPSLAFIAFFQALGLAIYCGLVGILFWQGEKWFGPMTIYLGPVLLLILLSTSVLICALLVFGYPVILFWEKKKTNEALKLVAFTAAWLTLFTLLIIITLTTLS